MSAKSKYNEIDLSNLKTFPMTELERKVGLGALAQVTPAGSSLSQFVNNLPDVLAARDLRTFSQITAEAMLGSKAVIVMFGGHVVKTGLAPLLIDWIEKGRVTALATNGAGVIHDTEIALFGRTSEDVAAGLSDGSFGMSRDTADFINQAVSSPDHKNLGYAESVAKALTELNPPCASVSILCAAYKAGIPLTSHVAIGADIIHQHPSADGAAIGKSSMRDFRIFAAAVSRLDSSGVVMNLGSAVVLPEVFLKALTIARNLGYAAHGFTAANFDMITHYRPTVNVLNRPTLTGGRKFNFTGHHEIQIPLLHALVGELLAA